MAHLVIVSFEIPNASDEDYEWVYNTLNQEFGVYGNITSDSGEPIPFPTTMMAGEIYATTADELIEKIKEVVFSEFEQYRLFVSVSDTLSVFQHNM